VLFLPPREHIIFLIHGSFIRKTVTVYSENQMKPQRYTVCRVRVTVNM